MRVELVDPGPAPAPRRRCRRGQQRRSRGRSGRRPSSLRCHVHPRRRVSCLPDPSSAPASHRRPRTRGLRHPRQPGSASSGGSAPSTAREAGPPDRIDTRPEPGWRRRPFVRSGVSTKAGQVQLVDLQHQTRLQQLLLEPFSSPTSIWSATASADVAIERNSRWRSTARPTPDSSWRHNKLSCDHRRSARADDFVPEH